MTKEERVKLCEVLGFTKVLQISKPDAKQTQKMLEEIDKRIIDLLSEKETVEKKVIEEHHYHDHYWPHYYPAWYEYKPIDTNKWTITTCGSGTTDAITIGASSSSITYPKENDLLTTLTL